MQDKLSKHITGFRKSHRVLFMDLSKVFDAINHDLLLPKLKAYGFSLNALDLMCSYLRNRID